MKKTYLSLAIIFLLCITCVCTAAEDLTIAKEISFDPETRNLSFLVNDNRTSGPEPEASEVSFDNISLQDTTYKSLPESGLPIVFCFVVDTTPTAFSYQTKIPAQLAGAFAGYRGNKADQYYLITYDTEVHEAAGPVQNPDMIFDEIKYAGGYNIVGDYSEALMKAVDVLDAHTGFCKKVIILITDGNQVKRPFLQDGGTNGLLEKLEKNGYPVYSFGLMQSETEEFAEASLKKIQGISNAAGGMYISYKDNPNPEKDFYDQICRSGVISGTLPSSYGRNTLEPTSMSVRLLRSGGAEIKVLTANIILPEIEGETIDIQPVLPAETETDTQIIETEAVESWPEKAKAFLMDKLGDNWAYILGAALLLIVLIILIIVIAGKSRKSKKNTAEDKMPKSKHETKSEDFTAVLDNSKPEKQEESTTYLTYLTDLTHGVTCSSSLKNGQTAKFGRLNDKANGVIGLGGDPHISRKQFTLTNENDKIILEDFASENGTYLNGEQINGKCAVKSGDTIRIGGVPGEREFRISITVL